MTRESIVAIGAMVIFSAACFANSGITTANTATATQTTTYMVVTTAVTANDAQNFTLDVTLIPATFQVATDEASLNADNTATNVANQLATANSVTHAVPAATQLVDSNTAATTGETVFTAPIVPGAANNHATNIAAVVLRTMGLGSSLNISHLCIQLFPKSKLQNYPQN